MPGGRFSFLRVCKRFVESTNKYPWSPFILASESPHFLYCRYKDLCTASRRCLIILSFFKKKGCSQALIIVTIFHNLDSKLNCIFWEFLSRFIQCRRKKYFQLGTLEPFLQRILNWNGIVSTKAYWNMIAQVHIYTLTVFVHSSYNWQTPSIIVD